MKRRRTPPRFPATALLAAFCAGALVAWARRTYGPPQPVDAPMLIAPAPSAGIAPSPTSARDPTESADTASDVAAPARTKPEAEATAGTRALRLPIDGMNPD